MDFDWMNLGAFLVGSTLTYLTKGRFGEVGRTSRKTRRSSTNSTQDLQPQGGEDEKPVNPTGKSTE